MINSPGTELAADINASATSIDVLDASKLPAAPNLVTVGSDETAETIRYTGKTGNTLTGCTRGFEGTAKGWAAGTQAARNHTAYDYEAGRANIADALVRAQGYADDALGGANTYTDEKISAVTANYIRQPGYAVTTGTASAYVATLSPAPTALPDGFGITIVPHVTNAAGATLNINGLGASPLKKQDGSFYAAGDLLVGKPYTFRKVGSDFLADSGGGEVKIPGQTEVTVTYSEDIAQGDMVRMYTPPIELLPALSTAPPAASIGIAMTNDYMVVGSNATPFLLIYKRSGDVFTKLANPSVLPGGLPNALAFSPNADYLYVGIGVAPYLMIYKRSGDTFTKLPDPTVLPGGSIAYLRAANDGTYIYMILSVAPYFMVYKRTGDTFTKLADPSVNPLSSAPRNIAISPSGVFIAISYTVAPYILIYKRSGDVLSKITDPSIVPPGLGGGLDFSYDENYLTVTHFGGATLTTYKRAGDVFNKVPDTQTKTPVQSSDAVYHPSKMKLFLVQSNNSPDILTYSQRGDQMYRATDSRDAKSQSANRLAITPDGSYLALASNSAPFVNVFKIPSEKVAKVGNIVALMLETDVGVIGYAKEGGSAGDSRKIIALIQ
jgi:6-phosphogluconolactonase (cycloisomerase 2 family)